MNLSLFFVGYTTNSKWLLFEEEKDSTAKLTDKGMSIYERVSWDADFTRILNRLLKARGIEWLDFHNRCKSIYIALEGMFTPMYRFLLDAHLSDERYKDMDFEINDYHTNALKSFSTNNEGIVCKVDIGGLVYGRYEEDGDVRQKRCGGWGPFSGEDGGGYNIGRKAVESVFMGFDDREEKDEILKDYVLDYIGISRLRQLIDHLRGLGRRDLPFEFFGLSRAVIEADQEGHSPLANKIMQSSADRIVKSIKVVLENIKPSRRIPIYFYGDVYEKSSCLQTNLKHFVRNHPLLFEGTPAFCPLLGMVYRFLTTKRSYEQDKAKKTILQICDGSPSKSCNKNICFFKAVEERRF